MDHMIPQGAIVVRSHDIFPMTLAKSQGVTCTWPDSGVLAKGAALKTVQKALLYQALSYLTGTVYL